MTSLNYASIRKQVDKALKLTGHDVAKEANAFLLKAGTSSGDPWNPTAGTPPSYPITVTIVDYTDRDRDGTVIQQNDRRALVSAEGMTVSLTDNDQLQVGAEIYDIVNVKPVNPAGTVVLYDIQVRKVQ